MRVTTLKRVQDLHAQSQSTMSIVVATLASIVADKDTDSVYATDVAFLDLMHVKSQIKETLRPLRLS